MTRESLKVDLGAKFNSIIDAMLQPMARTATFTIAELVKFYHLTDGLGKQGERLAAIMTSGIQRTQKKQKKGPEKLELPRNPRWKGRKEPS